MVNLYGALFRRDYSERLVSSFFHQIQSAYYGANRSVSIEGVALEHFDVSHHFSPLLQSDHVTRHLLFRFFS